MRNKLGLGLFGLLVVLAGCASFPGEVGAVTPTLAPFSYRGLGNIDRTLFNEPSGVVFCPGRDSLFLVGDEGDLAEIELDGSLLNQTHLGDLDLEGVTVVPPTGPVYVVVEAPEAILEVDPDTFEVLRPFPVEREFEGQTLLPPGGGGLEGITFVPDSGHPRGGTFYLANQGGEGEASLILKVELPLDADSASDRSARIVGYMSLGVGDLSGLHYDGPGGLFVVSDGTNQLLQISLTGEVLGRWPLPGENQEGITLDSEGVLYVAQDSGGLFKFEPKARPPNPE